MGRVKVKLTLDAKAAQTARSLGLDMSRPAETAIAEAARAEQSRTRITAVLKGRMHLLKASPHIPGLSGPSQEFPLAVVAK